MAVLGVIGHVDHGKSALVRALTGIDTDRLAEEKARGISITLGFAHLKAASGADIDLIDMPGHERFVRTLISGATGIDAVLLVVAANEGIKPQTVEHVDIAGLLGLRRAVVAVSKTDLVAPEQARRVAEESVQLLRHRGLEPLPPVMTSALEQSGMDDLRVALDGAAADTPPHPADGCVFLPIDRAFSIAGHGPVVTGTLRGGSIKAGDKLELLPLRRSVRVRAVQVHGTRRETAAPGQRVAVNLRDIEVAELARGMALAAPDTLAPCEWLTVAIRAVERAPSLKNGMRLRAMLGTTEVDARLRLLDRDVLEPTDNGLVQVHCLQPVAVPAGEHVILRLASAPRTVAGGRVVAAGSRRLRRNTLGVLTDKPASRLTLARRPDKGPARARKKMELALSIADTLRRGGLTPPNPGSVVTDLPSRRAVDRLLRDGVIIRAVDRAKGREMLFHQDAIEEARRRLAPLLERAPGLLVTEIGAALGISRRYSMPLLDHLDSIQFTRRVEDRRVRAEPAPAGDRRP